MTSFSKQKLLKYLGTLRGRGTMTIGNDQLNSCMISYEIDGYLERQIYLANGQIKGSIVHLARAFDAGAARIFLSTGRSVEVVLADPKGSSAAEIIVQGRLPL